MSSHPISDLIEQFLSAKIAAGLSPRTIQTYRQRLTYFARWLGDRPLDRPTIRGYVTNLHRESLSATSIASYTRDVSVFCNWLVDEGILPCTPAAKLTPKVPRLRPACYSVEQIQKLLRTATIRERAIILALLDTGLRASELCSLRRDRIDWRTGQFTVIGKGNKERVGWLSEVGRAAIRAYLSTRTDPHAALWYGERGPLLSDGVRQAMKRCAMRAGMQDEVRKVLHSFRVSFAKHYIQRGGDLESLRALLGHSTLTMAAHYAQLADDELATKKATVNPLAAVIHTSDN